MSNCFRFWILLSCIVAAGISGGQNLVANPGFELLDSCPNTISQIELAAPWTTFRGSVDLFNTCDTLGYVDVPSNYFGYQEAFEGNGYAGLISYRAYDSLHREFMGAELMTPLTPGVPVYISFRLAIGGWGQTASANNLSTSGVGVFFSTVPFLQDNAVDPLPDWAAIHCSVAPTDSVGWMLVSGTFVPDSIYTQIVVGIPFNSSELDILLLDSAFTTPAGAYVYIDAVCVSEAEGECPIALGQMPNVSNRVSGLFPNPCTDELVLDFGVGSLIADGYEVYDMRGALVESGSLKAQGRRATIETGGWSESVFMLVTYARTVPITRTTVVHLKP